jgi:hypothetical protein
MCKANCGMEIGGDGMVSKTYTNRALNKKKKAGTVASSRPLRVHDKLRHLLSIRLLKSLFSPIPSLFSLSFSSLYKTVTLFRKEERKPPGLTELLRPTSCAPTRSAGPPFFFFFLPFCAFD